MASALDGDKIVIAGGSGTFFSVYQVYVIDTNDIIAASGSVTEEAEFKFDCASRAANFTQGKIITLSINQEVICYDQTSATLKKLHQF